MLNGASQLSYDVSTAFLQGDSIKDLNAAGHHRQQVAFRPPPGVFALLHELDPQGGWGEAALSPDEFCIWLDKGAYGLKDAPLLWYIRFDRFLREANFKPMRHDSCVYFHLNSSSEINALLSLHVDDALATGDETVLETLHHHMESTFGAVTSAKDDFTHYGVHVHRCVSTGHVFASQKKYVDELKPLEIPKGKGDTTASPALVTQFRSLVSAIAWAGVTSPTAQAGASLYQSCLPLPTYEQCRHLNVFLQLVK